MKNAWRKLLVAGFIGSLTVAAGCVVGSGDDNTGGSGGSSGSGGSTGGTGGATGGASGAGATGGMAGSGATGGATAAYTCDNDKTGAGTPAATCDDLDTADVCQACVKTNCCEEWKTCLSENPNDACAFGGPKDATTGEYPGEIICFQQCVLDAGIADATTIGTCAGNCTSDGCGTISDATNGMVTCMQDKCFTECLQPTNP